ncbi:MAG: BamA/TamA family outer membrane protein [Gemmatimonadota bacterium]|nr:BamA/TamA family outer membrane protein [Gemmatimonadota bacterium]
MPSASAQVPPNDSWRSLETAHFRVTFPAELESFARRAGTQAERAYTLLGEAFVDPPDGRIELLVTDHVDYSNGFATAVPYNQITVYARPPMEGLVLSHFDDWLQVVILHELAHVFHLDSSGPLGSVIRKVMGRGSTGWPTFPAFDLPIWITEGLATYYESSLTGAGRLRGSFLDMVLRTAVLEGEFEGLDQVSASSPNWPAGTRAYAYGSNFFDYLLSTYGEESMGRFVDAISRQLIPYRPNSGAKNAFGVSFSEAWSSWEDQLQERYRVLMDSLASVAPITRGELLVGEGRYALFASVSQDSSRLAYLRSDGRSDVQVRLADPDGTDDRKVGRLNNLANLSWLPDGTLIAAELEFTDSYRSRSDLVHIDQQGRRRKITQGARLDQPTVSPDGRAVIAVQDGEGTNRLVRVDLSSQQVQGLTAFRPDEHWAYPSWSPDGRWIAASRWRPGAFYDLFVLNADGNVLHRVTYDRAVDQAPTWSPDGRWILWSSDRSGIPNLYAVAVDSTTGAPGSIRQVTNVLGGTAYPSVDPSGGWIYYSGYHANGWNIERIRYDPMSWFEPFPVKAGFTTGGEAATERFSVRVGNEAGPYGSLHTLRPHFWDVLYRPSVSRLGGAGEPSVRRVLSPALGVGTSGRDLVGRHAYTLGALFRSNGRTDGAVSYTYAGLGNPVAGLSFSQRHEVDGPFTIEETRDSDVTLYRAERERRLGTSGTLVRRRFRNRTALSLSAAHVWEDIDLLNEGLAASSLHPLQPSHRLGEVTALISFRTARGFAFSTSPEAGVRAFLQVRARREFSLPGSFRGVTGRDRAYREATGQLSAYRGFSGPGFSNHVVGVRASFGVATGPGVDRYHFGVGGAQGRLEHVTGAELFGGRSLLFPVRGYFEEQRTGRYAWSASAEYRFPLLNVHRGLGLFPLHVDRISGALFADLGNAWGPNDPVDSGANFVNSREVRLAAVGAELQTLVSVLYRSRLFFRLGVAFTFTDTPSDPVYLRLGLAF